MRWCPGLVGLGGAEPTYAFLQLQAASSLSASLSLILSPPPRPPSFTSLLQAPSPCCWRAGPFHGLKAGTGQVAGNEGPGSAGRGPGFWLDFSQASWPCPGPHTHHYFWNLLGDGQAGLALGMGFKGLLSQAGRVRRGVMCSSSLCHPPLFPSFLEHLIQNPTGLPAGSHLCILTPQPVWFSWVMGTHFSGSTQPVFHFAPSHFLALTHCRIFLGIPTRAGDWTLADAAG